MGHTNNYAAYVLAYPCIYRISNIDDEGCICALWLPAPCMPSPILCHRRSTSTTCTLARIPCTSLHAELGAALPFRRAPCRPTGQAGSASWKPRTWSACSSRTYASPSPSSTGSYPSSVFSHKYHHCNTPLTIWTIGTHSDVAATVPNQFVILSAASSSRRSANLRALSTISRLSSLVSPSSTGS